MLIIATCAALVIRDGGGLVSYLSRELITATHSFADIREEETDRVVCFRNVDGARLTIMVNDLSSEGRRPDESIDRSASSAMRKNWTPSGLSVGHFNRFSPAGMQHTATSFAAGEREMATVTIDLNAFRLRSESSKLISVEQEQVKLEAFTRDVLGGYAARRLSPDGNVLLGGQNYPAFKASGTNARLIELDTWLSRNNLTATASHDGTVLNFTKSGTPWIVPLGSVKIKKGEDWITMPDLVMRRSGKYLIPVSALN